MLAIQIIMTTIFKSFKIEGEIDPNNSSEEDWSVFRISYSIVVSIIEEKGSKYRNSKQIKIHRKFWVRERERLPVAGEWRRCNVVAGVVAEVSYKEARELQCDCYFHCFSVSLLSFGSFCWFHFLVFMHNINTSSNNRWCCLANRKREFLCLLNEENEDGPYFNFCGTTQISLLVKIRD
jgi:hypothetical protein